MGMKPQCQKRTRAKLPSPKRAQENAARVWLGVKMRFATKLMRTSASRPRNRILALLILNKQKMTKGQIKYNCSSTPRDQVWSRGFQNLTGSKYPLSSQNPTFEIEKVAWIDELERALKWSGLRRRNPKHKVVKITVKRAGKRRRARLNKIA